MTKIDYSRDFRAFFRDLVPVQGVQGAGRPIIPAFMGRWLGIAFPGPSGSPAARNIMDLRTKKEGKSTLAAAVALYMASRQDHAEVPIVAADQDQAKDRVLKAAKYAVEHGPLGEHARVYRDVIEFDHGSIIQAVPMDWQGAAGGNPACVIFDELHAWLYESNRRLFDEMVIPPTQPDGVRWIASYAGFEGESLLLRELWDKALAGERIDEELPIYLNRAASLLAFVDVGSESWRMPWMTAEYIDQIRASERANTFRRLWLNEWVSQETQFAPDGAWEACYSPDVKPLQAGDNARLVLGADASTSRDHTALVGCEWNEKAGTVDTKLVRVWKPQRGILRLGKPTVDLEETLGAEVLRLHRAGRVDYVLCDPYQLHSQIVAWEKAGIRVIEVPQTTGRVEADQALYDAINGRSIRHYNDPALNEHVRNAVAVETLRGLRLAKEKTSRKIDAAVALSMAHYGCLDKQKRIGGVGVTWIPDPFEYLASYNSNPDFDESQRDYWDNIYLGTHNGWNVQPHPPGVTWRNCKYRNRGCEACLEETIGLPSGELGEPPSSGGMGNSAAQIIERQAERMAQVAAEAEHQNRIALHFWKAARSRAEKGS